MGLVAERSRELLGSKGGAALGFYTTGQLFIEDYYTLALVARGGIGTNHLDGNTRLCTATAAQSLKETFGCDGQPAGVHDIEHCDTILHVGINTAETQTVLWMHELDRLRGPDPPRSIVIDPRATESAREADVHLAIKPGTNLAVLNGLARYLIEHDRVDREFVERHTIGFEALERTVSAYTPERVAEICGLAARDVRRAGDIIGEAEHLLTFVLQGVYQSHQATASACAANNINLLRGMIGKPGSGILQMNGQPTAQNTRETGCDGDLPGFRNWQNEAHVAELAELWNVEPQQIPHWSPPTHAMEIFRYAEQGSIEFLWVIGTNPAVSLPDLERIRAILSQEGLFLVVSDAFLTETARLADVVLPAALWGEKTGTFTNTDRTVHLSEQAVAPPGEARPDIDIFLDYARRLDLRDRDGQPLVKWSTPEQCFEAWKECTRGRPCDYTGLSYDLLRGGSGIQWPCNDANPCGKERLYDDLRFPTLPEVCEDYGHDLETGAALSEDDFRAMDAAGRAILKSAEWTPPHEWASDEYPFALSTGRTVYHFHTRTKTRSPTPGGGARCVGRALRFRRGAPRSGERRPRARLVAARHDRGTGTRRGLARGSGLRPLPLRLLGHRRRRRPGRAAACGERAHDDDLGSRLQAAAAEDRGRQGREDRMRLGPLLAHLRELELAGTAELRAAAERHRAEHDVYHQCQAFALTADRRAQKLEPFIRRYEGQAQWAVALGNGSDDLLQALRALYLRAEEVAITWTMVGQAAKALRDQDLLAVVTACQPEPEMQAKWFATRIKTAAPQALVVA
jgi:predicted molibdopterin-dependent oxidoreductase YjgC